MEGLLFTARCTPRPVEITINKDELVTRLDLCDFYARVSATLKYQTSISGESHREVTYIHTLHNHVSFTYILILFYIVTTVLCL